MKVLEELSQRAEEIILKVGACEVPVDEEFAIGGDFGGTAVHLEPKAFMGGGVQWARIARLKGGERVQVVNAVFLPEVSRGGPIFALELLLFGENVHLLVADLFGANGVGREALRGAKKELEEEFTLEERPPWGAEAFSDDLVFLRPGKRAELKVDRLAEIVTGLLQAWGEEFSGPTREPGYEVRRDTFLRVQREHEPARPFLERLAGAQKVERLLWEYLYPDLPPSKE